MKNYANLMILQNYTTDSKSLVGQTSIINFEQHTVKSGYQNSKTNRDNQRLTNQVKFASPRLKSVY